MKVELKNSNFKPKKIEPLIDYFNSLSALPFWEYYGMKVELDPTIDCKHNDALIRWRDIEEGFNDKLIVNSLEEFQTQFKLISA